MKLNLRMKLLIGYVFLLSLSYFILIFIFIVTRQYIATQVQATLLEKGRSASTYTRNFFALLDGYHAQIESSLQKDSTLSSEETKIVAQSIIRERRFIHNISMYNSNGSLLMRLYTPYSKSSYDPFTQHTSELFELARLGTTSYSSIYYQDNKPYMRIFYPVFSRPQIVIGVIEMQIDLQDSWSVLSQIRLGRGGLSYVVDKNGRLISHPDEEYARQAGNVRMRPIVKMLLQSTQTDSSLIDPRFTYYVNEKGVKVVAQAVKLPETGWLVVFEQPESEAFAFVDFTRNVIIVTGAVSILLLVIVAYILANNLTKPIIVLEKYAHALEKGMFNKPIHLASHDEIEALGEAFNRMAEQILLREKDLRSEKRQMETMIQSLADGVIAVDPDYRIILSNSSAEKILGISTTSMTGKRLEEVLRVYDHHRLLQMEMYTIHYEQLISSALFLQRIDKRQIPVHLRVSPVVTRDDNGEPFQTGWIIAFTDRTKELEIEDLKIDFVATATHELRTPLTSIRGYAEILGEESDRLSEEGRTYLKRLEISAKYLGRIIDNILDTSSIEKHIFTIDRHPINIVPIVEKAMNSFAVEAEDHHLKFEFTQPDKPIPDVSADAIRIKKVVDNLITNAIHFTPDGGAITVRIFQENTMVTVAVQDTGIGIPDESISQLFTKFFHVAKALKESTKGPGLGLYISKTIIDLHNGKIWVETEVGKGSTFYFSLPAI